MDAAEELIRLFDASEDAGADEEREQADKALYDFAFALLADVAGPAIGRVLERERDCPLPGEAEPAIKGTWWENPAGVNRALAQLLLDLKPALEAFPAEPVARDLIAAVMYNASAVTLVNPKRRRGQRDNKDMKEEARRRLVFAVFFLAGRDGSSVYAARDQATRGDIIGTTWKAMARKVPRERRDAVLAAGKEQAAAQREGRPHVLSDPDAIRAESDLAHLWDLTEWAVRVRGGPPKEVLKGRDI